MTTNNPLPGPGWHPDPHRPGYLRYWDGRVWTPHTSPLPSAPTTQVRTRKPWFRSWWVALAVGVLVIGGIGALAEDPDQASASLDEPRQVAPPDPSPSASEEPEPLETEEPEPTRADVPDLTGLDEDAAARALDRAGLTAGRITRVYSARPPGTVLEQEIVAGGSVLLGATVGLVVAKAIPVVPGTAGRLKGAAISALQDAGYRVAVTSETRTSGTEGIVLRQTPLGGTRLKPGGLVRIVVANVVRAVVAAPSSCTAGYQPCLAPMSDYDCAGGSGDGPGYANGPVYVTGSDPYDLDYDGDGVACES